MSKCVYLDHIATESDQLSSSEGKFDLIRRSGACCGLSTSVSDSHSDFDLSSRSCSVFFVKAVEIVSIMKLIRWSMNRFHHHHQTGAFHHKYISFAQVNASISLRCYFGIKNILQCISFLMNP